MGITLTANLGLVKPDKKELIPNWAGQNETTYEILDDILVNDSDTYVPSWTAVTTNPTLGSGGFVQGRYVTMWPNIVWFWIRLFVGTTGFNAGSGNYHLSLPFFVNALMVPSSDTAVGSVIGKMVLRDDSSVNNMQTGSVQLVTTSTILLCSEAGGGSVWGSSTPLTLSQSDRVSLYGVYIR